MNTPTIFKNIYIASTSPSLLSFFFFFRLLPISKVVSSLQLPVCNSHQNFFFFPSIYVCNNTSRVKVVDPIVSFSKLFLSFSLSVHSLVPAEIYILAKIDRNGLNDPKLSEIIYNKKSAPMLNACLTHGSGRIQNILN